MASTTNVQNLYEDIVADLIPYYDNMVLLGANPELILNSYNISGGTGSTMNIPTTNAWTTGAVIAPGDPIVDIAGDGQADPVNDFNPDSVSLAVAKRGSGTLVNIEDFEDGGYETVRRAVITRLASSIAQSTDIAGFNSMGHDLETVIAGLANVTTLSSAGLQPGANVGACELAYVFSPEAMGYAVKREPTVQMFENINHNRAEYTATLRNGFKQIRPTFIKALASKSGFGAANALTLNNFATSVAELRAVNAPVDGSGHFYAVITPSQELSLSTELNGAGATSFTSVSQDMANQALRDGLITQALGAKFVRSNNTPSGLESALS
jgi:hypothetical protein